MPTPKDPSYTWRPEQGGKPPMEETPRNYQDWYQNYLPNHRIAKELMAEGWTLPHIAAGLPFTNLRDSLYAERNPRNPGGVGKKYRPGFIAGMEFPTFNITPGNKVIDPGTQIGYDTILPDKIGPDNEIIPADPQGTVNVPRARKQVDGTVLPPLPMLGGMGMMGGKNRGGRLQASDRLQAANGARVRALMHARRRHYDKGGEVVYLPITLEDTDRRRMTDQRRQMLLAERGLSPTNVRTGRDPAPVLRFPGVPRRWGGRTY